MILLIKNIGLLILLLLMFTTLFITFTLCLYMILQVIIGLVKKDG